MIRIQYKLSHRSFRIFPNAVSKYPPLAAGMATQKKRTIITKPHTINPIVWHFANPLMQIASLFQRRT